MIGWLVRTSFKIQLLPTPVLLPFEVLSMAWVLTCVGRIWGRLSIPANYLWWWFALIMLYGLVLFGLAWKKEGVDGPESRFVLALVAFFMLPVFLVVFAVACIVSMIEEKKNE